MGAARGEPLAIDYPSPAALEWADEAKRDMSPTEHACVTAHLARAAADEAIDEARDAWRGVATRRTRRGLTVAESVREILEGRSHLDHVEASVAPVAAALRHARYEADLAAGRVLRALGAEPHPDAGPSLEDRRALAERCLAATADLTQMLLERFRLLDADPEALLRGLRWREGDGLCRPRERWRQLGAIIPAFERVLSKAVRVEPADGTLTARPCLARLSVPNDVRVQPGPRYGLLETWGGGRLVGRALGLALVRADLPAPLRRPPVESVARALGELYAERYVGTAFEALSRRERSRVQARLRLAAVLRLRVHAASVLARGLAPKPAPRFVGVETNLGRVDVDGEVEALAERALFRPVPAVFAGPLLHTPSGSGVRLRSAVGALAIGFALRDGFDEDWHRNPRVEEPLRAACLPGGDTSVEAWMEALGVGPEAGWALLATWG